MASSLAAFEAAIRAQSTHVIKSCLKTRKKGENIYDIYDLYSTLQSAKYNTNKRKKKKGQTDRYIQ